MLGGEHVELLHRDPGGHRAAIIFPPPAGGSRLAENPKALVLKDEVCLVKPMKRSKNPAAVRSF
jgi:hypothetical protein